MTSAHSMLRDDQGALQRAVMLITSFVMTIALTGCTSGLDDPYVLDSPFPQQQLWAVAPFTNESGNLAADPYAVADSFAEQVQQIRGIDTVPVNRVIHAMRQLDMRTVATAADADMLMTALNVDALIVGTVTVYDPYPPPKFGASTLLYTRDRQPGTDSMDTQMLVRSAGETAYAEIESVQPMAQAAGVFDARNHQVLKWLDEYANGRTEPDSAYGKDIYMASMELYTQFASWRLLHDLLVGSYERESYAAHVR